MRPLRDRLRGRVSAQGDPGIASWEGDPRFAGWILPRSDSWSSLATLGAGLVADVDERGRVVPRDRPLSIDFWIGASDRWWFPSREANTRQRRIDGLPIVETRVRVGSGDVVLTSWADEPGDGRGRIVVELTTETDDPVVIAVVVRPFDLIGVGSAGRIRVIDELVVVDGLPLIVLPRLPGDVIVGSSELGDVDHKLSDSLVGDTDIEAIDGSATLAVMLPLTPGVNQIVEIVDGRDRATVAPAPLDRTTAGWKSHLDPVAVLLLPGWPDHLWPSLPSGMLAAVASLSSPSAIDTSSTFARAACCASLSSIGLDWAAESIAHQLLIDVTEGRIDRDDWFMVAAAIARLGNNNSASPLLARHADTVVVLAGECLASGSGPQLGQELIRVVRLAAGDRAAEDAGLTVSPAPSNDRLARLTALGAQVGSDQPGQRPANTLELDCEIGGLALETIGLARSGRGRDPIVDIRRLAGSTWSWGIDGDADSVAARAMLVAAIRAMLVSELTAAVDLVPGYPDTWLGRPVDVTNLPTKWGRLSFSIRWHGARPALLWELAHSWVESGLEPFELGCGRLDPTFRSNEPSGEALLAAPKWALPLEGSEG